MKTIPKTIAIMILYSCLLSGCSIAPAAEQSHVYSFRGENEYFTISNGVIVLNDTKDIFYGGNLEETQGKFEDIVSYSTSVYLQSDDKDRILLCNRVEDLTGATINISDEIGKVSGDLIKEADLDELENNLFFELKTKNLNGEENEYLVQLILTKI